MTDWDKEWKYPNSILNNESIPVVAWEINQPDPNLIGSMEPGDKKAIDVGCGSGNDTKYLHDLGYDVIGYDISETAINLAKEKYPTVEFQCVDLLNDFPKIEVDLIYDRGLFHNLDDAEKSQMVSNYWNALSNNGTLFLLAGNCNRSYNSQTRATGLSLAELERTCTPLFRIKLIEEIIFQQHEQIGNTVGWKIILKKQIPFAFR